MYKTLFGRSSITEFNNLFNVFNVCIQFNSTPFSMYIQYVTMQQMGYPPLTWPKPTGVWARKKGLPQSINVTLHAHCNSNPTTALTNQLAATDFTPVAVVHMTISRPMTMSTAMEVKCHKVL